MPTIREKIEKRNEASANDMAEATKGGKTCGVPHQSLVHGIKTLGQNQEDIAEHLTSGGSENVAIELGKLKISANGAKVASAIGTGFWRAVMIGLAIYAFLALHGKLPKEWTPKMLERLTQVTDQPAVVAVNDEHR